MLVLNQLRKIEKNKIENDDWSQSNVVTVFTYINKLVDITNREYTSISHK